MTLPADFPQIPPEMQALLPVRGAGFSNTALLHYDWSTESFWCVPCRVSEFVITSRSRDVRQPVIQCSKCKRKWRVRDNAQSVAKLWEGKE